MVAREAQLIRVQQLGKLSDEKTAYEAEGKRASAKEMGEQSRVVGRMWGIESEKRRRFAHGLVPWGGFAESWSVQ